MTARRRLLYALIIRWPAAHVKEIPPLSRCCAEGDKVHSCAFHVQNSCYNGHCLHDCTDCMISLKDRLRFDEQENALCGRLRLCTYLHCRALLPPGALPGPPAARPAGALYRDPQPHHGSGLFSGDAQHPQQDGLCHRRNAVSKRSDADAAHQAARSHHHPQGGRQPAGRGGDPLPPARRAQCVPVRRGKHLL